MYRSEGVKVCIEMSIKGIDGHSTPDASNAHVPIYSTVQVWKRQLINLT